MVGLVDRSTGVEEIIPMFLLAAGMLLSCILLAPSVGYAAQRIIGPDSAISAGISRFFELVSRPFTRPGLLVLLLPVILALGYLVSSNRALAWFILPVLHIFAIGVPVLWLVHLGTRGLLTASPQRYWGIFAAGLILGPSIILFAELAAMFIAGLIGGIYIAMRPDLVQELYFLTLRLGSGVFTPDQMLEILRPYLMKPVVLFSIFAFTAGIVPLIEETFKPIGVWLSAGRMLAPAEGFVAGLISGAGFALFENISLTTLGTDWTSTVVVRMGTALLHIVTAGLTGWALAHAWSHRRYLRLAMTFLLVVFIHGSWNALSLLTAAGDALDLVITSRLPAVNLAAVGLGALAAIMFFVLLRFNAVLKENQ